MDYRITMMINEKIYNEWKTFLKSKNIKINGVGGKQLEINSATFEQAISKKMCSDNSGCLKCKVCDYDYLTENLM